MTRKGQGFRSKMAALSLVLVSESISATLILPFVGLFVAHLHNISVDEAGYLSGVLVSVFQLGQMITSKVWGKMSDRFGRKPMIQMGLMFNAIVVWFFGMSPNIYFCIIMRFLHGCANGNVLVAKTVIADITDKSNEGIGFATISLFWGVGSIVGPSLGGLLYNPGQSASLKFYFPVDEETRNIFVLHPALLPASVIAGFSIFVLMCTCVFLPETNKNAVDPLLSLCCSSLSSKQPQNNADMEDEEDVAEEVVVCVQTVEARPGMHEMCLSREMEEEIQTGSESHTVANTNSTSSAVKSGMNAISDVSVRPLCPSSSVGVNPTRSQRRVWVSEGEALANPLPQETTLKTMRSRKGGSFHEQTEDDVNNRKESASFGYREALQSGSTRLVLVMYMCIASTECALLEVIPLWAIASVEKGGLNFTSADLGWLMGASSVVCVIANVVFSPVSKWMNCNRTLWDLSVIMWALTSVATPCAIFIPHKWIFTFVVVVCSIREIGLSWAYALIYLFVARSAPESHVGATNGVAQSMGSLSRMITMLVLPPIFAWSLNSGYAFPFNSHFAFWLTNMPLFLSYLLSTFLSPSVLSG